VDLQLSGGDFCGGGEDGDAHLGVGDGGAVSGVGVREGALERPVGSGEADGEEERVVGHRTVRLILTCKRQIEM
jgi:hypothetical protein